MLDKSVAGSCSSRSSDVWIDSLEVLMNCASSCLVEEAGFSWRAERLPGFTSFFTEEEVLRDFLGKELFKFNFILAFCSEGFGGSVGAAPERWRTCPAGCVSKVFR